MTEWKLTNPRLITETSTSHVFKVALDGQEAVLKILTELGQRDESDGAIALRHFDGHGAARLLNADEGAHLLSFVDGGFLKELVTAGNDSGATQIICDVLRRLHGSLSELPSGLRSMEENFRSLFAFAKANPHDTMMAKAARVAEHLLHTEQERVVLHGDVHHKNILECSQRGWLAIDPKGLIGERAYDFANVFYNPDDIPFIVERTERVQKLGSAISDQLKTEPKRVLEFAFAFGCLSACWAIEDGLNPARRLRIAGMINGLLEST
jgi:streptomycin 6-kinase